MTKKAESAYLLEMEAFFLLERELAPHWRSLRFLEVEKLSGLEVYPALECISESTRQFKQKRTALFCLEESKAKDTST